MRKLHALLNELGMMEQKATLIYGITNSRTGSAKGLTQQEADALCNSLQGEKDASLTKMRGKIIHQLCLLGYVKEDGKADYDRINYWIKNKTGKNNPKGKTLHQLKVNEVLAVLNQVDARFRNELKAQANGATKRTDPANQDAT